MYQNIFYDYFNQTIHLWDDELGYHQLEHKPVAYLRDPEGKYETMNGIKCRKVTKWTEKTANSGYLYGHNVRPEVSMLIELYGDSDEISTNHCIAFIDIEVAKMKQHSTPQEARNPVTAISVYNTRDEKTVCFILDKEKKLKKVKYSGVDVHRFNTERELLDEFLNYWKELAPTIATGWNVLKYDFPYLYNRIERIYGRYQGNALSPINKVKSYTNKRGEDIFLIAGISILDYIELYKKFIPVESPSYTLDYIATKEIGRGKIKYTGDLSTLYETDIHKFIEYNIEDVKLVVDIDKKLDFIGIAMGICHAGHVPYEDFNFSSRFIEGAILTSLHRDGKIPMTKIYSENTKKAIGAFVKNPVPGIYKWVYDLDLRSLYPSIIMTLNISPETKVGKVLNWNPDNPTGSYSVIPFEYGVEEGEELVVENLLEFLKEYNIAIASNGMLYTKDYEGIIPKLISKWATQREEFRKLSDDAFHSGDMKTYNYYDRKQKIQKIFGNSIYGVTLLPPFRFYDRDNGEAVTVTGQSIIKHTATTANEFYSEATGNTLENSVIYCDTDSAFLSAPELIEAMFPNSKEEDYPNLTIKIASIVQDYINTSYDTYALEKHNVEDHKWFIKQELVAKRVFWGTAKKRYAMHVVRDGNKEMDKIDIKGFDVVKSDFPKIFRSFLYEIIVSILHDENYADINNKILNFKDKLTTFGLEEIMKPTSVKLIDKYTDENFQSIKKGAPVHVKSAVNYNRFLKVNNLLKYPLIYGNEKIKWAYLRNNPMGFKTLAMKGYEDPDQVVEYITEYIDIEKMFDSAFKNKLDTIWEDLGWGKIINNKNIIEVFEFN